MKLFNKLLVAPAALGLLMPLTAIAGEVNVNQISEYGLSKKQLKKINFNSKCFSPKLANSSSELETSKFSSSTFDAGSFSETTTASFSAEFLLGATEGDEAGLLAVWCRRCPALLPMGLGSVNCCLSVHSEEAISANLSCSFSLWGSDEHRGNECFCLFHGDIHKVQSSR